jgi:pSer/pThr/pTyr-binding forkhead associated (FHA) protein
MNRMRVELSVTEGSLKGRGFVFEGPACVVVGRGEDCSLRLPADREHAGVSRQHCLLEIAPPEIRVTDLGSLNGTFVNGKRIGKQTASRPSPETDRMPCWSVSLRDGDEVRVGDTVLRVTVIGLNEEQGVALMAQEQESCGRCPPRREDAPQASAWSRSSRARETPAVTRASKG